MNNKSKSAPLYLRGRVARIELIRENKHSIVFNVKVRLEFINVSDTPAIILRRRFWQGAETIARSREEAAEYKYLYNSSHWPSVYTSPEWERQRQSLDQPNPPAELAYVLAPKESIPYETDVVLYIEKAGSFDKTSQSWDIIRQASPVLLQVTLEMWPINIEPRVDPNNLEFGEMLQRRWQPFGVMQLENLTSEPMALDFSTILVSSATKR